MCGRYYIQDEDAEGEMQKIIDQLALRPGQAIKTGEVFPTEWAPVLANSKTMEIKPYAMRWGYLQVGRKVLINARSETAAEKKMFADGMREHRCLVPASGYFEWERSADGKRKKYHIFAQDDRPIYMAGIYRMNDATPEYAILTRAPSDTLKWLHDRMPVILPARTKDAWMDLRNNPLDVIKAAYTELQWEEA